MDPRKAAKVTASDLTKAFAEGHGMTQEQLNPGSTPPRIYIVLATNGEMTRQVFDFDQLEVAMSVVLSHLAKGDMHAAAVSIQVIPPEDWDSISDAEQ
jgi:hypothetical protein